MVEDCVAGRGREWYHNDGLGSNRPENAAIGQPRRGMANGVSASIRLS